MEWQERKTKKQRKTSKDKVFWLKGTKKEPDSKKIIISTKFLFMIQQKSKYICETNHFEF